MLQHVRCCSLVPANKRVGRNATGDETPLMSSEEELRRRIYANARVLFPSSGAQHQPCSDFEIVFASCPICSADGPPNTPAQYAMLVRRAPSGDYVPLLKGEAFSTAAPWTRTLQSLFSTSARAIHRKFDGARMPALEYVERLPRYEATDSGVSG